MRILGIDPGFERLGIAIIDKPLTGKEVVIHSECFHTSPKIEFHERLALVGEEIRKIIESYKPKALAIEKLYITTNQKTAMNVAEARGVVIYEASRAGLGIYEYTPGEIKMAITGYGKATKDMVMAMVPKLCKMDKVTNSDDELDAVAIGLTCCAQERFK
jgi:crossover junction endodeoxyribonuclease RuvC